MRASEMVRELLRQATPANAANAANGLATPSFPPLRMLANACESVPQAERATPSIRSHSQPFANPQTQAQPSDSQDSQDSQPTRSNVVFLRPVTCATCQHQLRRPDTSEAGMSDCARGRGLHFAGERHACADHLTTQPKDHV